MARQVDKKKKPDPFAEYETVEEDPFEEFESVTDEVPSGISFDQPQPVVPQIPQVPKEEEESGFLKQVWDAVNKPVMNVEKPENEHPHYRTARLASELLTPLNIGTTLATGGSSLLAKGGFTALARALGIGAKGLDLGVGAHGANELINAKSGGEALQGGLELGGSILGLKQRLPQISKSIVDDVVPGNVNLTPPMAIPVSENVDLSPRPKQRGAFPAGPTKDRLDELIDKSREGTLTGDELIEAKKLDKQLRNADLEPFNEPEAKPQHTIVDTQNPKPQNLIADGKDVIDEATGEVIDMTDTGAPPIKPPIKPPVLAEISSIHPESKQPIDPIKHKPAVKVVSDKEAILNNPSVETVQQMNDNNYYTRRVNEDGSLVMVKRAPRPKKVNEPASLTREIYNLPRGMMSVDLPFATSAAFRQAKPFIGTGNWFKAWGTAAKSFGSEEAFQSIMNRINHKPLFQKRLIKGRIGPSIAEEMGLDMTDLKGINGREEALRSSLAEKIPLYGKYIRASNRAYTGFLNDLRANTLEDLFDSAKAIGRDPLTQDKVLGQGIAEFINTATGRGKLGIELGSKQISLEKNAKLMADVFFAPKLMASNVRMLNPSTYITADPFIRKQYMLGMLRSMGTWGTIAGMAKLAGADVTLDPRSSDFAKIKIGNTRIDLGGGMQQYLVLAAREIKGQTKSSTSNDITEFGKGFKAPTGVSTAVKFGSQKLHPTAKFAWDMLNASEYETVGVGDRVLEMALPMYIGDLKEILEENPELAPLILGLTSVGIGSQTYEGGPPKPSLIPRKYDFEYKGGRPW